MSTTQPIRSKQLLHDFKEYYLTKQPNSRNYTLILIGLNTALRINDILHLTWGDVYCTEHSRFYTHLLITEKKTEKETRILINRELQETLLSYRKTQTSIADTDYLFPSPRKADSPLYDAEYAKANTFGNIFMLPGDMLRYLHEHDMLPEARINCFGGEEEGKKIVKDNFDFFARMMQGNAY